MKVARLQTDEWQAQLIREGLSPVEIRGGDESADGGVPCPACGTVAPLVDGACSDCGLMLG